MVSRRLERERMEMDIISVVPKIDGEKLAALREEAFLSQRELAIKAGVSPQTVLNIEQGVGEQHQRRTVRKLAAALGVKPGQLVEGRD
jgi:transcriptional regulator with XRE-family HTH domain